MNYCNMKIKRGLETTYYELKHNGRTHKHISRDNAINKALDLAVGAANDIKIFKVTVVEWVTEDGLAAGLVKETTTKELALLVSARPIRGTGGWIDYEE